jgi:hypothetical protein
MNKYDFFIAARYRNKDNALRLANLIREKGYQPYCFVESNASTSHVGSLDCNGEEAMTAFEAIKDWQNDPRVKDIFKTDMDALRVSETHILLLPAGKSAHMETGVSYGLGKKMICIGEQKETESLYIMFDEFHDTIEEFIDGLDQK